MSKIFVCGDTHGSIEETKKLNNMHFPMQEQLTKQDVVIQLGDFGWVWSFLGKNKEQEYWLDWLASKNFTLAVVLGNHENYDIIEQLPTIQKWGNELMVLKRDTGDIFFFKRGLTYMINNKKILIIGGALSIDKANRKAHISWWEQEELTSKEIETCLFEIDKHEHRFDYILTHTCPQKYIHHLEDNTVKVKCSVSSFLDHVDDMVTFTSWHFGHFHQDKSMADGKYRCHYDNPPFELGVGCASHVERDDKVVDMTYFDLFVYQLGRFGFCVLERDIQKLSLYESWEETALGLTLAYLPKYGSLVYLHDWERFAKSYISYNL